MRNALVREFAAAYDENVSGGLFSILPQNMRTQTGTGAGSGRTRRQLSATLPNVSDLATTLQREIVGFAAAARIEFSIIQQFRTSCGNRMPLYSLVQSSHQLRQHHNEDATFDQRPKNSL
jgi:hypothetical protein